MKYFIYIIMSIIVSGCAMMQYGTKTTISIPTTQCGVCDATINEAFSALDGVDKFDINIDKKYVIVNYDISKLSINDLETTIANAGYKANDMSANPVAYGQLPQCCKLPQDRN